jgi:hypothetical protein
MANGEEKPLDEVVPSDTDRLVKELRGEKKPDGSRRLSDKTIAKRATWLILGSSPGASISK